MTDLEFSDWRRHLAEPGLWIEQLSDMRKYDGRGALFLDRDGTINMDTGYPSDPTEVALLPVILPAIRAANLAKAACIIVTNQSGIARGILRWEQFVAVNARVVRLLSEQGCRIDMVLACAYHEEGHGLLRVVDHPMRKPNPGMLLRAAEMTGIDLSRSVMVGDRERDLEAGRRAGVASRFLIGAGTEIPARLLAAIQATE